ncbi:PAS domain-containing protein [Sphingomicrobium astaxanthinifaciens]|uniref:PAS domain-containing protein n=1 Tax=Sphingomicrobium astaxanthinifaciens TaxID=1227949 RepID=UPI001FCBD749|nr:PAS domain-containing protein [Sphingomicrobium astaxanthinifaciens]MCJ7420617.1 PAS domain-containing protein [Sphingomicrobium astaxanthinifaciens]
MVASLDPFVCQPAYRGDDGEAARLGMLARYDADSLADDDELNALSGFAASLCEAPIALVTLVEAERQRFLSRQGVALEETAREVSFCQHAMVEGGIFEIPDATRDARFADNPLVTGEPQIRFYAGAPLVSAEGAPMGALCVISPEPRSGLTPLQRERLLVLARAVMRRLDARRRELEMTAGRAEAQRLLRESQLQFDSLADALPQMAWSTNAEGAADYFNRRWYEFTGVAPGSHDGDRWIDAVHPDDRGTAASAWADAVRRGEAYETEYRIRRHDGEYRWTLARGLPVHRRDGAVIRWFGTNTDIDDNRRLVESHALLTRELSHRIKNIFSVVTGLVSFASRKNPEMSEVATSIGDRINALGRAHNYVRPLSSVAAEPTSLRQVLTDLFAPYAEADQDRVRVHGDDVAIREQAVTPIALAFHELATNAVKYGALSEETGQVDLVIERHDDQLTLRWREHGGPAVSAPEQEGFGSDLLATSVERQLHGTFERDWRAEGLQVNMSLPLAKVTK